LCEEIANKLPIISARLLYRARPTKNANGTFLSSQKATARLFVTTRMHLKL